MTVVRNLGVALAGLLVLPSATHAQESTTFESPGNPILGDGSVYSADPAPLVINDTLYILSGRDEADASTNAFVIKEWQIFEATNPDPAGGEWTLHRDVAQPEGVFSWAEAGAAYASQIVAGPDGRYYLYAPVEQSNGASDPFSIGVGVSDSPLGPFEDAYPDGPIVSQSVPSPGNNIHNIDPTVLVNDEGRVFMYWGSFNELRGVELDTDMVTIKGDIVTVDSLTGYFEAPYLIQRDGTYYLLYAANNAGADSPCTPTSYHACLAYGTASSPLGPWTFGGVFLGIVSSTTSHPGAYKLGDSWFLVYHTADAEGGGHFRRSIAIDALEFDDTASPAGIKRVKQTFRASLTEPKPASRNIAPLATVESKNETPIQYWTAALNDERILSNPLPPDYWASYAAEQSPETSVLTYTWNTTMDLNGVAVSFFADQPAGSNVGIPPPASWTAEYLDGSSWKAVSVTGSNKYPTEPSSEPAEVSFDTVSTTGLRITITASGSSGQFGGVGVHEWFAYSPEPVSRPSTE